MAIAIKTKEQLREEMIAAEMRSCKHFNGIQNRTCKAGIPLRHSADTCLPCLPAFIRGRTPFKCDLFQIMTREEAEKEADRKQRVAVEGIVARIAAYEDAETRGLGKGNGGSGELACPVCKTGKLRYRVAASNGHMHARCSTQDCVSWME